MDIEGRYAGFTLELRNPGIAWLCLSREKGTLNGFTAAMKHDLTLLMREVSVRPDIRVLVFTGANGAFCAGDDFNSFYDDRHDTQARSRHNAKERRRDQLGLSTRLRLFSQKLTEAVYELDLITIAAIDGPCIQSALSLALACDFRLATPEAKIGSGTLRFGFQPDENGHFLLVRQIGVSKTLDFMFNNRILNGNDAHEWGLVNEVVARDRLEDRAMEMALQYAEAPQIAIRLLKRAIYRAYETDFRTAGEDIALRTAISDHAADAAEGVAAFNEKRRPKFNQDATASGRQYIPGGRAAED